MTIRLREDFVAIEVEVLDEKLSNGGIILNPHQAQTTVGVIRFVGPGKSLDLPRGERKEMDLRVGDRVRFEFNRGEDIEVDGVKLKLIQSHFIRYHILDEAEAS
jgi:co-chaperonin GroES (HSP10)